MAIKIFNFMNKINPGFISFKNPSYIETDQKYITGLFAVDYSNIYKDLILKELIKISYEGFISVHISKSDKNKAIRDITRFIGNMNIDKNEDNTSLEILNSSINDAKFIRKELQIEGEELVEFTLYIMFKNNNKELLNRDLFRILDSSIVSNITFKKANFRLRELFKSTLPLNNNSKILKEVSSRKILTKDFAGFYPFISNTIYDTKGVLFGKESMSGNITIIDRFDREKYKNGNMCILGSSGSGKSFFTKLQILRERLLNRKQFIIDPEKEYKEVAKVLNGEYISFGGDSNVFVNILDLKSIYIDLDKTNKKEDLDNKKEDVNVRKDENIYEIINEKIKSIKPFFKLIFKDMDKIEFIAFEKLLKNLYLDKVTTSEELLIEDVYNAMKTKEKIKKYADLLNIFVNGELSFFNKKTNVDLSNKLIVADISNLGEENYKYGIYLFLNLFWNEIKKNKDHKKIIYIDEIWKLIGNSNQRVVANYVYNIFKTIRKYNASAVAITQDIYDLFKLDNGNFGATILNNSTFKSIFSLNDDNINKLNEYMYLSEKEKVVIRGLNKGKTFFVAENNNMVLDLVASEIEKEIIEKEI